MRIHQFHQATTAASKGEPMEPTKNDVWVEVAAEGNGAVNATVQMKGRINALSALQAIGSPVTITGTASPGVPVTESFKVTTGARYLYAELTAVSAISFRAEGSEAER